MRIKLCFGTDGYPSIADNLGTDADTASSSAFLRAMEANGSTWTLRQWKVSPYAPFLKEIYLASGLCVSEFEELWRNLSFLTGGSARAEGLAPATNLDSSRQEALLGLLPQLVAKAGAKIAGRQKNCIERCGGVMHLISDIVTSSPSMSWCKPTLRLRMHCGWLLIRLRVDILR
jgi:hypothetical protein